MGDAVERVARMIVEARNITLEAAKSALELVVAPPEAASVLDVDVEE
jgi:hypothetical protein